MIQLVALMSVFGVGVAFSVIGSMKLELSSKLGIDDAKIGGLISVLMFTCSIAVLLLGVLTDMIGFKPIATIGFILGFVSVILLVNAKNYGQAIMSCMLLGIAAMCMNLGNTLIPVVLFGGENEPAASNFGNVFFGLGAFIAPFLIGMLLKRIGFKATGSIIAVLLLIPVLFTLIAAFPAIAGGFSIANAFVLLTSPVILVAALALFCYIGLEVSMGGWITTYATEQGFSPGGASMILSLFWVSVMAARLTAAAMVTPAIGAAVIAGLAVFSVLTLIGMMTAGTKSLAALFIILTGLAFGPLFPTIVGVTFSKTDPALYGSAFGIIFAIGLLGGSTIPAAIGMYAKGKSIQKSLPIAILAAIVLAGIAFVMGAV